jgi:hypothetical protein
MLIGQVLLDRRPEEVELLVRQMLGERGMDKEVLHMYQ